MSDPQIFEVPDKYKLALTLLDPSESRPETQIGLFDALMAVLTTASGQAIYSGGVILLPHGLGKLYHPNGELKYSGTFLDNQYHGKGDLWSEDGKPEVKGEWSNGKKNGYCKVYNESGKLASIGMFEEDAPTGDHFATFHESGYIKNYGLIGEDGEFCNERSYEFDSTGTISRLPQMSDEEKAQPENGLYSLVEEDFGGTQWGACVLETGSPPTVEFYCEDLAIEEVTYKEFNDSGCSIEETERKVDVECLWPKILSDCESVNYFGANGLYKYKGKFSKGKFEGTGTLFDEDEKRAYNGQFVNDLQHCETGGTSYYPDGKRFHEGGYFEGKFSGAGHAHSPETGNRIFEGTFENGVYKKGKLYWDEIAEGSNTPNMLFDGEFNKNGQYHCEHGIEYYKNGKKKYEGRFINGKPATVSDFDVIETRNPIGSAPAVSDIKYKSVAERKKAEADARQADEEADLFVDQGDWEEWGRRH